MEEYLPLLGHLFHLKPWDLDRMTVLQVARYLAYAKDYERQSKEAADG